MVAQKACLFRHEGLLGSFDERTNPGGQLRFERRHARFPGHGFLCSTAMTTTSP
jgi:hypothetical protein